MPAIRQRINQGTVVHADESPAWNKVARPVRHVRSASTTAGRLQHRAVLAEPMRRSPISPACAVAGSGHHHHIAGPYLLFAMPRGGSLAGGPPPRQQRRAGAQCCPSGDAMQAIRRDDFRATGSALTAPGPAPAT